MYNATILLMEKVNSSIKDAQVRELCANAIPFLPKSFWDTKNGLLTRTIKSISYAEQLGSKWDMSDRELGTAIVALVFCNSWEQESGDPAENAIDMICEAGQDSSLALRVAALIDSHEGSKKVVFPDATVYHSEPSGKAGWLVRVCADLAELEDR